MDSLDAVPSIRENLRKPTVLGCPTGLLTSLDKYPGRLISCAILATSKPFGSEQRATASSWS
jgi:hypothetical protein